jgi:hypothetical protein
MYLIGCWRIWIYQWNFLPFRQILDKKTICYAVKILMFLLTQLEVGNS